MEVADSAVLGGVVEVVSSILAVGNKNIFQHFLAWLIYFISSYIYVRSFILVEDI